jgi:Glycosyltransferase
MKKEKILYVTSLSGKRINSFMRSAIVASKNAGFDFTIVSNESNADKNLFEKDCKDYGINHASIPFERQPLSLKNLKAYHELKKYLKKNDFSLVHCNTPIGGALTRICAHKIHQKNIIYQAHGFHFYKGGNVLSWLIFFPIEKWLSHWTDTLITINKEDTELAKRHMKAKRTAYVPGVGIDVRRFAKGQPFEDKKKLLGLKQNDFLIISVGEMDKNKNQIAIMKAMIKLNNPNIYYAIIGQGILEKKLRKYALKKHISSNVFFPGFQSDTYSWYQSADLFILPSYREGLPSALMEAMASSLPVIASDIRGVRDLIDPQGGALVSPNDPSKFANAIAIRFSDLALRKKEGDHNACRVVDFSFEKSVEALENIYKTQIH